MEAPYDISFAHLNLRSDWRRSLVKMIRYSWRCFYYFVFMLMRSKFICCCYWSGSTCSLGNEFGSFAVTFFWGKESTTNRAI